MGLMPEGGGGGYFHMYAYWVCAARDTPIFSPEFLFRSISFSQISPKSVPEHHHFTFLADFAVRETVSFRTQSVRQRRGLAAGQSASARRVLAIPESSIFTLKTALARSGAPHFKAQMAQTRSGDPHFPRTGSAFRSPCPCFTLPRHIPTKIWG